MRKVLGGLLGSLVSVATGCSAEPPAPAPTGGAEPVGTTAAAQLLGDLRQRFVLTPAPMPEGLHGLASPPSAAAPRALLPASLAHGFVREGGLLRANLPAPPRRLIHRADTLLPARANGAFVLRDADSGMTVDVSLEGVGEMPGEAAEGYFVYRGAVSGADLLLRVHHEGVEDYVHFPRRPAEEELRYRVGLRGVAGLRFVAGTLEFLDQGGAPRLRMGSPWGIDADGKRFEASVAVDGCSVDRSTALPWGRAVTSAGAEACSVSIRWGGVRYPSVVDPAWTATGSMASARRLHTATALADGQVLVAGGVDGSQLATAEVYNPAISSWASVGSMATPRFRHTATALAGGGVLVAGGNFVTGDLASSELFDPAGGGSWTNVSSMAFTRNTHTATALIDGRVLVAGGFFGGNVRTNAEVYDPAKNSWASAGSMAGGRVYHTATVLADGRVLVAGGEGQATAQSEVYDPSTNSWMSPGTMVNARAFHTATLLGDGRVLVAGGASSNYLATTELYNPATNLWAASGTMAVARAEHSATSLPDGFVLLAGGGQSSLGSTEVYNPGTSLWGVVGSLVTARSLHTATALPGGRVLIAGGLGGGGTLALCEELSGVGLLGSACSDVSECLSKNCVDGVCCNSLCLGACDACSAALSTGPDGTCSPSKDGSLGAPACAGGVLCNGQDAVCPAAGTCVADSDCAPDYYCSSDSHCSVRKSQGAACAPLQGGDCKQADCRVCQSGFCSDGVCCDEACSSSCDVCSKGLGASQDGLCSLAAAGYDGTPSCASIKCSGVSATCPLECEVDAQCKVAESCNPVTKTCDPVGGTGSACKSNSQCTSGICADGFCCNVACNGACEACSADKKGYGADGVCQDIQAGTDPDDECPSESAQTCKLSGMCDGKGACSVHPAGTSCGASSCADGKVTGQVCDGQGACTSAQQPVSCFPFTQCADASTCAVSCGSDSECTPDHFCDATGGKCLPDKADGMVCKKSGECASNFCVDGICCNEGCGAACQTCKALDGEPADLDGICRVLPMGKTALPGHPSCGAGEPGCQSFCDGSSADCTSPAQGSECAPSSCAAADVVTLTRTCDGAGKCEAAKTESCAPFVCDAAAKACKTKCTNDKDCSTGAVCGANGQCTLGAATCADKNTAKAPDGTLKKCDPYTCLNGQCRDVCASDLDCVGSFRCDAQVCVPKGGAGGGAGAGGSGGSGGSAGQGGSALTGGSGGASAGTSAAGQGAGGGGAGGAGGAGAPANDSAISADDSGCGCRTAGTTPPSGGLSLVGLGLALALGTRRRR
jgi:MYXO-CTERM domain-containing protein